MACSFEDELDVSFERRSFERIGDSFLHCLSFFIILQKSQQEYQEQGSRSRRSWSAGSFVLRENERDAQEQRESIMAEVVLKGVCKNYGEVEAVKNVDLRCEDRGVYLSSGAFSDSASGWWVSG